MRVEHTAQVTLSSCNIVTLEEARCAAGAPKNAEIFLFNKGLGLAIGDSRNVDVEFRWVDSNGG